MQEVHLSEKELEEALEKAKSQVRVGARYRHYRDRESLYVVVALVFIEASQEVGVLYRKEQGSEFLNTISWVRPLNSWLEKVFTSSGPTPRFQEI